MPRIVARGDDQEPNADQFLERSLKLQRSRDRVAGEGTKGRTLPGLFDLFTWILSPSLLCSRSTHVRLTGRSTHSRRMRKRRQSYRIRAVVNFSTRKRRRIGATPSLSEQKVNPGMSAERQAFPLRTRTPAIENGGNETRIRAGRSWSLYLATKPELLDPMNVRRGMIPPAAPLTQRVSGALTRSGGEDVGYAIWPRICSDSSATPCYSTGSSTRQPLVVG